MKVVNRGMDELLILDNGETFTIDHLEGAKMLEFLKRLKLIDFESVSYDEYEKNRDIYTR